MKIFQRWIERTFSAKKIASVRPKRIALNLEVLEDRVVYSLAEWQGYAENAQHTALSTVASQSLQAIHWQTPVDLDPQYASNGELLIHYGSPSITANNTVIVPVKTGAGGGFEVEAFNGATGEMLWTQPTDYQLLPYPYAPNWTPSYAPTLTPQGRYYFAGDGGTVYFINDPDSPGATISGQIAFFGAANYNADPSAYNSTVFINTPITSDSSGNIYFGFVVTGSNPLGLQSGIARISPNGTATYVSAAAAAGNPTSPNVIKLADNCAPALSNDGSTLYIVVNNGFNGIYNNGYLVALNSTTLAYESRALLVDPVSGEDANIGDDSTASPTVGPDGEVFIGVLENPFPENNYRGWLLQFSANLSVEGAPAAFGWDDSASIVPASMAPSYDGTSSYLLMIKYNNYLGIGTGNGLNQIAIVDPNAAETYSVPVPGSANPTVQVMAPVLTMLGPTPSPAGGVYEWCINSAAVDPATDSILVNSEDGHLYRWDLATNTFTQSIQLTSGLGEAYTPTLIGADGTVYAIEDATLFAVGNTPAAPAVTNVVINGDATSVEINSASESGNTVTVTTRGQQPFAAGETIEIAGVAANGNLFNAYNGIFTVNSAIDNHDFTYVNSTSGLPPASNENAPANPDGGASLVQSISSIAQSGSTVTVSFANPHGFTLGDEITIAGASASGYDGTWAIAAVPSTTTFTFIDSKNVGSAAGGTAVNALIGSQRSEVTNIVYTFSEPVTLNANTAFSIALAATTGSSAPVGALPTLTWTAIGGTDNTEWVVTFSGNGTTGGNTGANSVLSIANGAYNITLDASSVANADGENLAASQTDTFYRLFGDAYGDERVNVADAGAFSSAYNFKNTAAAYLAYFDFNNDGLIVVYDSGWFSTYYNLKYKGFTATI